MSFPFFLFQNFHFIIIFVRKFFFLCFQKNNYLDVSRLKIGVDIFRFSVIIINVRGTGTPKQKIKGL